MPPSLWLGGWFGKLNLAASLWLAGLDLSWACHIVTDCKHQNGAADCATSDCLAIPWVVELCWPVFGWLQPVWLVGRADQSLAGELASI